MRTFKDNFIRTMGTKPCWWPVKLWRRTYTYSMVKKGKQAQKVVLVGEGTVVAGIPSNSHGLTERDHVSSSFRRPSLSPLTKMSVSLNPSHALGFRSILFHVLHNLLLILISLGPFNILVKRSLTITNNNPQPVAFKVKTTAPKVCFLSAVMGWLT